MKIAMINGSPKVKGSASGAIMNELQALLSADNDIVNLHFTKKQPVETELELLMGCDAMIFVFPLYADTLPSHLISCLLQLENRLKSSESMHHRTVYAIVNCGFYEGRQNTIALDIMKCWCEKAGVIWGGGLGVGGGGMMPMLSSVPTRKGPKKNFSNALDTLSNRINRQKTGDNICFSPNFPRFLYKMAAEMGWRQAVKNNGLKTRDLWNKQV